jgi:hypothetical protein
MSFLLCSERATPGALLFQTRNDGLPSTTVLSRTPTSYWSRCNHG